MRGNAGIVCGLAAVVGGLIQVPPAYAAQQSEALHNTFGEVGMLDMPSAHMARDGELAFTISNIDGVQHYNFSFQALPWAEASFRYSRVVKGYYDRSFEVKVRVLRESDYWPDVSVGTRDLLGTGIYSSEYVAVSKNIGDFDLTGALGWGRLADTGTLPNPLGFIRSSFNSPRGNVLSSTPGIFNLHQIFHGPRVGVFGGVVWQTPIDGLKVVAEYSSDRYTYEEKVITGHPSWQVRSPVNVGLSYQISSALAVTGGWFYGSAYGIVVSFSGDGKTEVPSALRLGPDIPPPAVRPGVSQQSALLKMNSRNAVVATVRAGGPWVHVPTAPELAKQELLQALYSQGRDVRNVDIEGNSLVVDARVAGNPQGQCSRYAQIASATQVKFATLAVVDLQNPDGTVTFCNVASRAIDVADVMQVGPDQVRTDGPYQALLAGVLRNDLGPQALTLESMSLGTSEIWVYIENGRYRDESEAIGRVLRILMADAPPSIEIFHVISMMNRMPMQQVTITRSTLERVVTAHGNAAGLGNAITISAPPLANPAIDNQGPGSYPRFFWQAAPKVAEHLFDPDKPLQLQVFADIEGAVAVAPGLAFGMGVTANIWNDYRFGRPSGSDLPHVRSDLLQYVQKGAYGMSYLNVVYKTRLARDVFAEATGGYLEDMFMGAGGQVLWRPEDSRFAVGADLYQVWKRNFDRLFGVQNYDVLTGHVSLYYRSPWHGVNFAAHVGRYLAKDYGVTFEITRRLLTGVEVGAFATITNVPGSKFGEGSFDKGLIIRIPLEWALPVYSQSSFDLTMHSLTRDGGQRLSGDDSLYDDTRRTSYGEIADHLDNVVEP